MSIVSTPRRSPRLAKKPAVKYFTEADVNEDLLLALCTKKGWNYSEELLQEFNEWSDKNPKMYVFNDTPTSYRVNTWAYRDSKIIAPQIQAEKDEKAIRNYCTKNNIEYDPVMLEKFQTWKADNKSLITYTRYVGECMCLTCMITNQTTSQTPVQRPPSYCVKKWFSTLKKNIEW
jgi:hypothetical protein